VAVQNDYEDLIVRGRAAIMLGNLKDPRAVDPLIRALDAPGFQTPLHAAEALGKLGDPRAIPPLVTLATSGRDKTRDAALEAQERCREDHLPASTVHHLLAKLLQATTIQKASFAFHSNPHRWAINPHLN
jgi:HEAT repeat protein